ncbi:ABC transporter [Alteraurantiacibacter aquimixticola]|uniref:ABC transporter n=1 Tax=Alteraurantiacibacter aquimixticola TaxID=2489173 RepID=A0A4T3F2E7_9SPHN|nr:ABC transporter [Alteraurantiacibacter aquimixticola]TIX51366.1 ABC transporter [Alteraurantiacibacter aquimixticola]
MIRPFAGLAAIAVLAGPTPLSAEEAPERAVLAAPAQRPVLALMGTVPIYWGEADGLSEVINGDAPKHWARAFLEQDFQLAPLDFLTAEALSSHKYLLMAQPRALAAEENVAVDRWVRDGGKLLLFADPMMTGESRFSIGDRRRAQDVALLSPILARWGLELTFAEGQSLGLTTIAHGEAQLPVNLPGRFVPHEDRFECVVSAGGLIAHCAIETGEVMLVADAAMLDVAGPWPGAEAGLAHLYSHIFGPLRENAGHGAHEATHTLQQGGNSRDSAHRHEHRGVRSPP